MHFSLRLVFINKWCDITIGERRRRKKYTQRFHAQHVNQLAMWIHNKPKNETNGWKKKCSTQKIRKENLNLLFEYWILIHIFFSPMKWIKSLISFIVVHTLAVCVHCQLGKKSRIFFSHRHLWCAWVFFIEIYYTPLLAAIEKNIAQNAFVMIVVFFIGLLLAVMTKCSCCYYWCFCCEFFLMVMKKQKDQTIRILCWYICNNVSLTFFSWLAYVHCASNCMFQLE